MKHRGTIILVSLAAATITAIGISNLRGVLAPVLLALVLTVCVQPVRVALEKRGVPHGIATGSVALIVFLLLAGFVFAVVIALAEFVAMLPKYAEEIAEIGGHLGTWLKSLGIGPEQIKVARESFDISNVLHVASGALGSVFGLTGTLVIILTMLILMAGDSIYVPMIMRQLTATHSTLVTALQEYATNVRRYMTVTTVLGVIQGALNAVALLVLQVPAAFLWGLLAFLCSFIPNVGYFIAILPPLVFAFIVGGWPTAIAVVIVYGVINAVIQSVFQPRIVGNAVSLSQSLTFLSVLFWAILLGPIGAILAVPMTLLVRAVLVDANPNALLWRPALGDVRETRLLLKQADETAKQERRARNGRSDPESPDADAPPPAPTASQPTVSQPPAAPSPATEQER